MMTRFSIHFRIAARALIAMVALGCGSTTPTITPTPPSLFRTQHVVPGGDAVQVVLQDLTGLVTGIGQLAPAGPPIEGVANAPGIPDVLWYGWIGGMCDTTTSIAFEHADGGFRLTATTQTTGGSCRLAGIYRGIGIALSESIDPGAVMVHTP